MFSLCYYIVSVTLYKNCTKRLLVHAVESRSCSDPLTKPEEEKKKENLKSYNDEERES